MQCRQATASSLVAAVALFPSSSARGCVDHPERPPVRVEFLSPTEAWVCIDDYQTFGSDGGQVCVCALRFVGPIELIEDARIVHAGTGQPVPGFSFAPDDETGAAFAGLAGQGFWQGFSSLANLPIPAGVPVNLKFRVRLGALCAGDCPLDVNGDGVVNIADVTATLANFGDCVDDPCPWDVNCDGTVDRADLNRILAGFGRCGRCPWDVNDDSVVNTEDLIEVLASFGPCLDGEPCPWDVNGDGVVDETDVDLVTANFGPCPPPRPNPCPWDVNGDGVANTADLTAVLANFGPCPDDGPCPWDVNGDGVVDDEDLELVIRNFGPCCLGDVNHDGQVNVQDLIAVLANFGPCPDDGPCPWDVNHDGVVNQEDVEIVIANYGPCFDCLQTELLAALGDAPLLVGTDEGTPAGIPTGAHLGIAGAASVTPGQARCPGDTNGDGWVNVDDLNNIFVFWGTHGFGEFPPGSGVMVNADVADFLLQPGPDCDVNVNDLVLVIKNWTICYDVTGDAVVDEHDVEAVNDNFGPCPPGPCPWDVNDDGVVNVQDLTLILANFGPCRCAD